MLKVMLACCAGMSTSLLVQRMKDAAKTDGLDAEIWAVSEKEVEDEFTKNPCDVLLLGPQIRYKLNPIKKFIDGKVPVDIIDMRTYGMMDGKKVLEQAVKMLENFK